tara:strand:+ start:76 stop:789 length:714 start_codon:yes stop_codon:yes gene_type:complete
MEFSAKQIETLERVLGYEFDDKALLEQSLTHPSYLINTKDQIKNNQRLEFLGDSVIQLILTEALYQKFPEYREGDLTKDRSGYARGDYMAGIARNLELHKFLLLKDCDRASGLGKQDSALGDAFEAVIGAIYIDSDFETTRQVVLRLYENLKIPAPAQGGIVNPKGRLQEIVQPIHGNDAIEYTTTKEEGEPHDRTFEVDVLLNEIPYGTGRGRSKKEASESAALAAIANLEKQLPR